MSVKKSKLPKFIRGVLKCFNAIITIFIVAAFVLILVSFISKNGYSLLGFRSYIVMSGSMSPTFDEGSYILVRVTDPKEINKGDIITFETGTDAVVTHRVEEVLENGTAFITKGDANNISDIESVPADRVLGVAVHWFDGIGSVLLSLNKPQNIVFCVLLLILIYIMPEFVIQRLEEGRENIGEKK